MVTGACGLQASWSTRIPQCLQKRRGHPGPDVCSGRSQREICLLGRFNSAWVREFTGESLWGEGTIYVPFTVLCLHMSENLIQVPQAKKRFPVPMTEQFRATRGFSCGQPWAPVPG